MARLSLSGVTKRFDGASAPAIPNLDLVVPSGAMAALVGPSGCGKSTTLRMVAGLEEVSAGAILIDEREVTHLPPADRDIAMVFQSYALYPHMTVFENMAFGLRIRRMTEAVITERVTQAAKALELVPYLERLPKALSGGQRQRVAIGRALVREPQVFLFDEPLSNLDAKLRGEMRREIARIHRDTQTTSLYVTHDQVEAMTLADMIVVMRDGVVQQIGAPTEIYNRPANRFVAGFFGTPSMNFLHADVQARAGQALAVRGDFALPLPADLANRAHDALVVGFRPEDLALASQGNDIALPGAVTARELLGAETVMYVETAAGTVTVRAPATQSASIGAPLTVWLPPRAAHFFDQRSEARL